MIKETKNKLFSILAITYAFTSLSTQAKTDDVLYEEDDHFGKGNIKIEAEKISFIRNREEFLESEFESGNKLEWKMKNDFSIFESKDTPFGVNEKGLQITTELSDNTYSDSEDDILIKSNTFPAWALSKFDNVQELEEGIKHINITKEGNDSNLNYIITDKDFNTIVLKSNDGNLYKA